MSSKIADVLRVKPKGVCCVPCTATLREASSLMMIEDVGCVLVDDGGIPVGILSEHDALMAMTVHRCEDPGGLLVAQAMYPLRPVVAPGDSIADAVGLMTSHRRRHLAVVDSGIVRAIVSKGELTRRLTADLDREVSQLIAYMHGPYTRVA